MRWVVGGLILFLAFHIAAYALGQSPEVFLTRTLPSWAGYGIGLVGLGIVVMQVSRR